MVAPAEPTQLKELPLVTRLEGTDANGHFKSYTCWPSLAHLIHELDPHHFAGGSWKCDCGHRRPGQRAHAAGANDPANPGGFGRGRCLWRKARCWNLALYALEGAVGLPVFANFQAGLFLPTGEIIATGGYIIGFILAAGLVGYLVEKGWGASVLKLCAAMLLGAAVLYVPGLIWLAGWLGVMKGMDATSASDRSLDQRHAAIHSRRYHQGRAGGSCIPGGLLASRPPLNSKIGRSERIRTSDPLLPKQVRYQTALHSDICAQLIVTGNSVRKLLRGQGGSAIGGSVWGVAKR